MWRDAAPAVPRRLRYTTTGRWWDTLYETEITLLVTREYEHLVVALGTTSSGSPTTSYLPLPHPSGLAVDHARSHVFVASTRNPNQVFQLAPATSVDGDDRPLIPVSSSFHPGSLYLHDLAFIGSDLYGNAVGQNAVVRFAPDARVERAWWPLCIETEAGPRFDQNFLQLNSIAAGADLRSSFFSASTDRVSTRRPGHQNFPVDGRGVIFSGATREPIAHGLTRPHSARLHVNQLWVANSGYGELALVNLKSGKHQPITRLKGWTRGLAMVGKTAFVGTSRVIPRFHQYAPGLDVRTAECGVHAVNINSGEVLGSLLWPDGNQIFGVEWLPRQSTSGLPLTGGSRRSKSRENALFYSFQW